MPASSIIAGVAAAIYSKGIAEQVFPLPNTLVMNSLILSKITQSEGIEYPNPSYGYGVFNLQRLNDLLTSPLLL